jgi:hypothetical protein
MTLSEHIQTSGKNPASVQKQWRRKELAGLISRPFSRDLVPTPDELALLFGQAPTIGQPDKKPVSVSASVRTDTQMAKQTVKQTSKRTKGQQAVLVGTMVVCALLSSTNMYDISYQVKPNAFTALLMTCLFSLAPFAMLYAGVSGWAGWLTSGICIAYEVFCNASGIYRGLAGLGSGAPYEVWQPGGFIDTVSRVTTLDFKVCALVVSFGMAGIVAALFLISLIELKKC